MEDTKDIKENYFTKLSKVKCEVDKKNWLNYISWAESWSKVKEIDENANYIIYENENGYPFWASPYGIDVKVWVIINWLEHIVRLPVMDWANRAMKEQGYTYMTKYWEKTVEPATTFDINKAIQRAFVKAIAMFWLWLYVYLWEDLPPEDLPDFTIDNFQKFKEVEKYKDEIIALWVIEKKYQIDENMRKLVTEYYQAKNTFKN